MLYISPLILSMHFLPASVKVSADPTHLACHYIHSFGIFHVTLKGMRIHKQLAKGLDTVFYGESK